MDQRNRKKCFSIKKDSKTILNYPEKMCLLYLRKNLNADEISKKMNITSRTVNFYLKSAMLKLRLENLPQLIEYINRF